MAGRIDEMLRPDSEAVHPRYRAAMEQKFGQPVRFRWLNEKSIDHLGWRNYHAVEKDPNDQEQSFSPDSRVRSGDRFLGVIPESEAQKYEMLIRAKRMQRLLSIQQGGQLGSEVAALIRRGLYTPKYTELGFNKQGMMVDTDAAAQMGVDPNFAKAPWVGQGHDSQPTPNELADHIERMGSQADLPAPSPMSASPQVRALEASQRWGRPLVVGDIADNPNSLGNTLRKSGD